MTARFTFADACQIVSPPTPAERERINALSPEREAEIAGRYPGYRERMERYGLEALSPEGFRYSIMTLAERITQDHGPQIAATMASGPAEKGTFERAFVLAADRKAVR